MLTIDSSPQVNVGEGSHPERVKVYGPGVEKTGLKANEPTYFTVDCSEAGQGALRTGEWCGAGRGLGGRRWHPPPGPSCRGTGQVQEVVEPPAHGLVPASPQAM